MLYRRHFNVPTWGFNRPFREFDRLRRQYDVGKYHRQFNLYSVIDQSKIDAKLNDGVLRLSLPKVEEVKPRQIEIKTG